MYGPQELVELGQRVAEDGPHRHERALLEVAFLVQPHSPGAAAVLADATAPRVLRERALSVASDALLRTDRPVPEVATELQELSLDWQGELAGWGA